MPSVQSTAFCLTFNGLDNITVNIDPENLDLPQHPLERFAVWQIEVGDETGAPHIQAYLETSRKTTFNSITSFFVDNGFPHPHVQARRGTPEQAKKYCEKEETRLFGPWSRGIFGSGGQGSRSDLASACGTLVDGGFKAVAREHPEAFVKYHRGFKALEEALRPLPLDDVFVPHPWQARVLDMLQQPANDRSIIWITDQTGGRGKSCLARHLIYSHRACQVTGRMQDMAEMYNYEPIVVFDVSRAAADNTGHLYSFAEMLKNGIIVAPKYESRMKCFKPPHVIFFSNSTWDRALWTNDRVLEMDLLETRWHLPADAAP